MNHPWRSPEDADGAGDAEGVGDHEGPVHLNRRTVSGAERGHHRDSAAGEQCGKCSQRRKGNAEHQSTYYLHRCRRCFDDVLNHFFGHTVLPVTVLPSCGLTVCTACPRQMDARQTGERGNRRGGRELETRSSRSGEGRRVYGAEEGVAGEVGREDWGDAIHRPIMP